MEVTLRHWVHDPRMWSDGAPRTMGINIFLSFHGWLIVVLWTSLSPFFVGVFSLPVFARRMRWKVAFSRGGPEGWMVDVDIVVGGFGLLAAFSRTFQHVCFLLSHHASLRSDTFHGHKANSTSPSPHARLLAHLTLPTISLY